MQRTQILKQNQFAGSIHESFGTPNIRRLVEDNYVIIYLVKGNTDVDILTIQHPFKDHTRRTFGL